MFLHQNTWSQTSVKKKKQKKFCRMPFGIAQTALLCVTLTFCVDS